MAKYTDSYCYFVQSKEVEDLHRHYHDHHYGFPLESDDELFGRLILEINQAGLSWTTILKKQENFRRAYAEFNIERIANFDEKDRERLLNDAGIIRNKLKVNAAIHNAQVVLRLQKEFGSFGAWIQAQQGLDLAAWVKLFKQHFKFVGGEIVNEFLMSTGFLPGAHHPQCPIYPKYKTANKAS